MRQTGRCRLHGGLSTGPRTKRGKARVAAALRARWRNYRRDRDMTLEALDRLLHLPRTGKPCGAKTAYGPCTIEGFQPTGRCHFHGAAARKGPKGPRRRLTKAERREMARRVRNKMFELGMLQALTPADRRLLRDVEAAIPPVDAAINALNDLATHGLEDLGNLIQPLPDPF
jgi:hypothetical protein